MYTYPLHLFIYIIAYLYTPCIKSSLMVVVLAQEYETQGRDGSGVIRKKSTVAYGPTKTSNATEEEKWKRDKLDQAIGMHEEKRSEGKCGL